MICGILFWYCIYIIFFGLLLYWNMLRKDMRNLLIVLSGKDGSIILIYNILSLWGLIISISVLLFLIINFV